MKYYVLIILVIISNLQAQYKTDWFWQNYSSKSVKSLQFLNEWTGYAVFDDFLVAKTINKGAAWIPFDFSLNKPKIHFVNEDRGIAIATNEYKKFLTTEDGGKTWTESNQFIFAMDFINSKIGWGANYSGLFLTADGGFTWRHKPAIDTFQHTIEDMSFYDTLHGCLLTYWGVYLTEDGGQTFTIVKQEQPPNNSRFADIIHIPPGIIIIPTLDGYIECSEDNGVTWKTFSAGSRPLHKVINDNGIFWVCGEGSNLWYSKDSGNTWIKKTFPVGDNFYDMQFYSKDRAYIGGKTVWHTENQFETITLKNYLTQMRLFNIHFLDSLKGFVLGEGVMGESTMYQTSDGGFTWEGGQFGHGLGDDIFFVNDSVGWIVQRYSGAHKTTDGGKSWQEHKFEGNVFKANFINENSGYVVGWNAYRTDDGGNTWTKQLDNIHVACVHMFDSANVLLLGGRSVFRTYDAGTQWDSTKFNFGNMNDLYFFDDKHAIAAAGNGIARTVDSGKTWTLEPIPNESEVFHVDFMDNNTGWACGYRGVYKTIDQGINWQVVNLGFKSPDDSYCFIDVSVLPNGYAWICGTHGRIFATPISRMYSNTSINYLIEKVQPIKKALFPNTITPQNFIPGIYTFSLYSLQGKRLYKNTSYYNSFITLQKTMGEFFKNRNSSSINILECVVPYSKRSVIVKLVNGI